VLKIPARKSAQPFARRLQDNSWLMPVVIALYIFVVYSPMLQHDLLGTDELQAVHFVSQQPPFAGFVQAYWFPEYYRPLQVLQGWLLYHLFGLDYFGYQFAQLLAFSAAALTVYYALSRISGSTLLAGLLALVFAAHPFVQDYLVFTIEVGWLTLILAGLVALWVFRSQYRLRDFFWLFILLFTAALARENGLALTGAVLLVGLVLLLRARASRRRTIILLLTCVAAVALYAIFRVATTGLFPHSTQFANDGFIFRTYYSEDQVRAFAPTMRLVFYAYAVAANLGSILFPLVTNLGALDGRLVNAFVCAALLTALSLAWFVSREYSARHPNLNRVQNRVMIGLEFFLALGAGVCLAFFFFVIRPNRLELGLALYGALSLLMLLTMLWNWRAWAQQQSIVVMALGLIGVSSVLAFSYFRYRNLYLALFGWLILLAIGFQTLTAASWQKGTRYAVSALLIALVIVNGVQTYKSFPLARLLAQKFDATNGLCKPVVPTALALQVAAHYNIDPQAVLQCRKNNSHTP
jgi:hypothetical protein